MNHPPRFPWNHFPPVYIHAPERTVKKHSAYMAAEAGDIIAAMDLVAETISQRVLDQLWHRFSQFAPVLVSSHSEAASGINAIPEALSWAISDMLKWPCENRVAQSSKTRRSVTVGEKRLLHQVLFEGPVVIGLNYLLVDDFVSQGGTFANLRGHIMAQDAYVIGATALSGNDYAAELALSRLALAELRSRHGHIEYWWRQRFGFGFECLTASEARYLSRARKAEKIIESLEAAD